MSKYKVSSNKSLIKITRKFWGRVPVSERELAIFAENLLPGFWRPHLEGKHRIVYTVPSGIPLREYMEKSLTIHKLYNVLAQVVEITRKVDMYGFYLNNLVLDKQLIYVKEITGELYFLYEPLEVRDNSTNVYAFLSDLIAKCRSGEREVMEECKRIRAFLDDTGNYRMEDIERFIMSVYPQIYQQVTRAEKGLSGFITSSRLSYRNHYGTGQPGDGEEGQTVLLGDEDEEGTVLLQEEGTVLLQQPDIMAHLQRTRTGEEVLIRGGEFHIGKDAAADYTIRDNKAVSRRHAVICCNGSTYSVRDENATNHTYLNGKMLEPGDMEALSDGDVIRLADEEFVFSMN